MRLREMAVELGITERRAFSIVCDLADDAYIVKEKEGRRNCYRIQEGLPFPEVKARELAIGEVLAFLTHT